MIEKRPPGGLDSERALTTAYPSNTRPSAVTAPPDGDWHPAINRLLAGDYAFLGVTYEPTGHLFRGIECGLGAVLERSGLRLNEGGHSLAALERELGVCLISKDLSDELAVAKFSSSKDDAALFVFDARLFATQYAEKRAAVLGFAEPGVVFEYPFFAEPPALTEVELVIVWPQTAARFAAPLKSAGLSADARLLVVDPAWREADRWQLESYLWAALARQGIGAAHAVPAVDFPKRGSVPA